MKLTELIRELEHSGISVVGTWQMNGCHGIYLGDPNRWFPHPTGPQYPVDCTDGNDRELLQSEVDAIRRRFAKRQK